MELILNPPYKINKKGKQYISVEDWENYIRSLPYPIYYIFMSQVTKSPIGLVVIEQAIKDYPEYFKKSEDAVVDDLPIIYKEGFFKEMEKLNNK